MAFSAGKYAWGICDISGQRYRLKGMKTQWNGLRVGYDQFDTKHPQLDPKPKPVDPEALKNARPDTSDDNNAFVVYTNVDKGILGTKLDTFEISTGLGEVTITAS